MNNYLTILISFFSFYN